MPRQAFALSDVAVAIALPEQHRVPAHLARSMPGVTIVQFGAPVIVSGREALEALRAALVPEE